MAYKIELRYLFGWDDAEWTEEDEGRVKPLRFQTVEAAQTALNEFFSEVKTAVAEGNMDSEEARHDFRIVETED